MTGHQRRRLIHAIDQAKRAYLATIHLADIREHCLGCGITLDDFNLSCPRCLDRRRKRAARARRTHGVA